MIEKPTTGHIPVGYVDQYGNFELLASDWMQEEPGIVWKPVFFEEQKPLEHPFPYSQDPAAPVAQREPCRFPGCQFTGCPDAGCYDAPSPAPGSPGTHDQDKDVIIDGLEIELAAHKDALAQAGRDLAALRSHPVSVQTMTKVEIESEYLRQVRAADVAPRLETLDAFIAGVRFAERKHGINQEGGVA